MSWATNIVLIVLSLGVLVQTARLMIVFRQFKRAELKDSVSALEHATAAAQVVLDNLRTVLSVEARGQAGALKASEEVREELSALRDELSVMVGVGNSVAERIELAASVARMGQGVVQSPIEGKAKIRRHSERPVGASPRIGRAKKPAGDPQPKIAVEAGV
jgi:hypothetical protein